MSTNPYESPSEGPDDVGTLRKQLERAYKRRDYGLLMVAISVIVMVAALSIAGRYQNSVVATVALGVYWASIFGLLASGLVAGYAALAIRNSRDRRLRK